MDITLKYQLLVALRSGTPGRTALALDLLGHGRLAATIEDDHSAVGAARERWQADVDLAALDPIYTAVGMDIHIETPESIATRAWLDAAEARWAGNIAAINEIADALEAEIDAEDRGFVARAQEGQLP